MKRLIVSRFVFMLAMIVVFAGIKMADINGASPFGTLCDAVDNCNLTWSTSGPAHWYVQTDTTHDKSDALRSGAIGDNQSTYLHTMIQGPGTLKFWWKVSSELYYDNLSFFIDSELQARISGTNADWKQLEFTIPTGIHTLKWEYSKDFYYFLGSDCGWVDEVEYTQKTGIVLSRIRLAFGAAPGTATGDQTFSIGNNSANTLNWSVSDDQNWLNVTPHFGTDTGVVTVSVDATGLTAGTYSGFITVSSPSAANSPQQVLVTLKVYRAGGSSVPFGVYTTPGNGATIFSSVPFTGWVLDDVGVDSVKLYRHEDNALIYIGEAVFVEGARPDVEQAYTNYPYNDKAGWGYMMLTNFLPNGGNGTFTIEAIAEDFEGRQSSLGTKTVIVDNANAVKPFGAIDTPAQGGNASGSLYRNEGWVLTPQPNTIPMDGSTINVYVDGVKLGHPTYNVYREDIAMLFPGYSNSGGAHVYFEFDTTAYQDGVHTIAWTAVDDAANGDGIGSRYFTIRNSSGNRAQNTNRITHSTGKPVQTPGIMNTEPIGVVKGFRKDAETRTVFPDYRGIVTVDIKELERIELHFGHGKELSGWMVVGDRFKALPVGSSLDRDNGIFYWQPGAGFCGDYRLFFVETDASGNLTHRTIIIRISPGF
jgi:hypothetical protein